MRNRRLWLGLCAVVLAASALRLRCFMGLQIGDDVVYSSIAVQRLEGRTDLTNVHEMRAGFIAPIVASYALFGPGEVPLVLYNLLGSLGTVVAVFFLSRRLFSETAGWLASVVAAAHPVLVCYATECHTDTPVAFWSALALLAFLHSEASDRPARLRVLAGLLLGWAWLHKESALFFAPFFLAHGIALRRRWTEYVPVAAAWMAVFVLECAANGLYTGDPFRRFAMVRAAHTEMFMAGSYASTGPVLVRVFLEPALRLFVPTRLEYLHRVVSLAGLAAGIALLRARDPGARRIGGWWLLLFLAYSFWPSSLWPYLPSFFIFEWTLPPLVVPLVCLLGAGLARLPRARGIGAMALLLVLSAGSAELYGRMGRRFGDGPREAHRWIERNRPARVVSDAKSVEAYVFLEGHRPRRIYEPFGKAPSFEGAVVIVDRFWTEPGRWWSQPLPGTVARSPAGWTRLHESGRVIVYRP
jgi:4-amino-4-deoxy-L-arabinose transferase-like glycosyltransferase